jgi:hypothetical protein
MGVLAVADILVMRAERVTSHVTWRLCADRIVEMWLVRESTMDSVLRSRQHPSYDKLDSIKASCSRPPRDLKGGETIRPLLWLIQAKFGTCGSSRFG